MESLTELKNKLKKTNEKISNIEIPEIEVEPIRKDRTETQNGKGSSRFQINEKQEVEIKGYIKGHQSSVSFIWEVETTSHTGTGKVYKKDGETVLTARARGDDRTNINQKEILNKGTYIIQVDGEHENAGGKITVKYHYRDKAAEKEKRKKLENEKKNKKELLEEYQQEKSKLESEIEKREGKKTNTTGELAGVTENITGNYKIIGLVIVALIAFMYIK